MVIIKIILLRVVLILTFFIFISKLGYTQDNNPWFYLTAKDTLFDPHFKNINNKLYYIGEDPKLKVVLDKHTIYNFKKTYRNASKTNLKKTFFVISDRKELMYELLEKTPHLFKSGEFIPEDDKKIYEPNDYGLTSTIGENLGAQVNLDYLDFLGVPKAWYYTTGSKDIIIGIADGFIDTLDIEFRGKTKMIRKSSVSKGHGYSVAESAAGNGNNAYGIAGVCYDCSVYTTSYGSFNTFKQLKELSNLGARVINCSWGSTKFNLSTQQIVDSIYNSGTILVAAGHNDSFSKTNGKKYYYPASYRNVIAVSSGMHRYNSHMDNIQEAISNGEPFYYANNIKGYVGRNAGFTKKDTLKPPYLYRDDVRNLNDSIDILGPAVGIYRYGERALNGFDDVSTGSQTSGVAPLVTGTIGLMFSLYPCLPVDEVESILKITSWNIDHIEVNKPFYGYYGSGMLQTGNAVELVYKLYSEKETAYIQNQDFPRWDFKLTALSKKVVIQNQKFRDDSRLNLRAKNQVVISENTHLKPNENGSLHFKIDPTLEKKCDLRLRDPSIEDKN